MARGKYTPMLAKGMLQQRRNEWSEKAPKLTEDQLTKVQNITRSTYDKYLTRVPTRNNFNELHERIEEELNDKIRSNLGLMAALEWKVTFGESATSYFRQAGMKNNYSVDGVLPTNDFLESELFDYVQEFNPILILLQFDDYDKFMKSAEESILESEKRRAQGDAYFTQRDRDINYRSDIGSSDALDDPMENNEG